MFITMSCLPIDIWIVIGRLSQLNTKLKMRTVNKYFAELFYANIFIEAYLISGAKLQLLLALHKTPPLDYLINELSTIKGIDQCQFFRHFTVGIFNEMSDSYRHFLSQQFANTSMEQLVNTYYSRAMEQFYDRHDIYYFHDCLLSGLILNQQTGLSLTLPQMTYQLADSKNILHFTFEQFSQYFSAYHNQYDNNISLRRSARCPGSYYYYLEIIAYFVELYDLNRGIWDDHDVEQFFHLMISTVSKRIKFSCINTHCVMNFIRNLNTLLDSFRRQILVGKHHQYPNIAQHLTDQLKQFITELITSKTDALMYLLLSLYTKLDNYLSCVFSLPKNALKLLSPHSFQEYFLKTTTNVGPICKQIIIKYNTHIDAISKLMITGRHDIINGTIRRKNVNPYMHRLHNFLQNVAKNS